MMNVGLYFGSFNPVHKGHTEIAKFVLQAAMCTEVWFVVSPQNPLKNIHDLAPENDRLTMIELAVHKLPGMKACDIEFTMPKPSYTVKTLETLKNLYPGHIFSLITGMDNLQVFKKWKSWKKILDNHTLFVYPRNENTEPDLTHPNIHIMKNAPLLDISSSMIRQKIIHNEPVHEYLDNKVMKYIRENGIYE